MPARLARISWSLINATGSVPSLMRTRLECICASRWAKRDGALFHYQCSFKGDRDDVRRQAVKECLKLLLSISGESEDVFLVQRAQS